MTWAYSSYCLVAALLSVAGANLIVFTAVDHVGVSLVSLTLALPPMLTYLMSLMIKLERYHWLKTLAIVVSFLGMMLFVYGHWQGAGGSVKWTLITLIVPILLAGGNIYRTVRWPGDVKPPALAFGMLLMSVFWLTAASLLVPSFTLSFEMNEFNITLIASQAVVFKGQFILLFLLQQRSGPVFLSLIGSIGAFIGIPVAVLLLGEPLTPMLIPGGLLIAIGVSLMVKSQTKL